MKILICGDRNWTDKQLIKSQLQRFILTHDNVLVIHGAARGADLLAGQAAKELGLEVREFPADWKMYGKSAGPIRNRQMIMEQPDIVWAFHDDIRNSAGTKDMVKVAEQSGYRVILFWHEDAQQTPAYLL